MISCELLSLSMAASADADFLGDNRNQTSSMDQQTVAEQVTWWQQYSPEVLLMLPEGQAAKDLVFQSYPCQNKPADDLKSYRPISRLGVPCKILERLNHSCIKSMVDPNFHQNKLASAKINQQWIN